MQKELHSGGQGESQRRRVRKKTWSERITALRGEIAVGEHEKNTDSYTPSAIWEKNLLSEVAVWTCTGLVFHDQTRPKLQSGFPLVVASDRSRGPVISAIVVPLYQCFLHAERAHRTSPHPHSPVFS